MSDISEYGLTIKLWDVWIYDKFLSEFVEAEKIIKRFWPKGEAKDA